MTNIVDELRELQSENRGFYILFENIQNIFNIRINSKIIEDISCLDGTGIHTLYVGIKSKLRVRTLHLGADSEIRDLSPLSITGVRILYIYWSLNKHEHS